MNRRDLMLAAVPLVAAGPLLSATAAGAAPRPLKGGVAEHEIDAIAAAFLKSGWGPGLSVAAMQAGRPLFAKGYGCANLETGAPVTPETIFRAGSVTKQFVAAALMRLVEAGKVDLDAPAARYLTELAPYGSITVRNLLTHTSGLRNYSGADFEQEVRRNRTPKEMVDYIMGQSGLIEFQPGERFEYSNSNYFLAGVLVERVGGRPLTEALDDLTRAADMPDTILDHEADIVPHRASGYSLRSRQPGRFVNAEFFSMDAAQGAGGFRSRPLDLVRWHHALFGGRIVSAASLTEMITPAKLRDGRPAVFPRAPRITEGETHYGLGLQLGQFQGQQVIGHGGNVNGFSTFLATFPARKLSVALMVNTDENPHEPVPEVEAAFLKATVAPG